MRIILLLVFGVLLCSCGANTASPKVGSLKKAPNILLIVADDLGYGDLGCFGAEIQTPTIDSLAQTGVLFTRFHTAPMCAPSRAMLLTGNDNHIAGIGAQGLATDHFGYEGYLTNRIVSMPQLLQDHGYHTYMAGKWHIGMDGENHPANKGFEESFALLNGAANHYSNRSSLGPGESDYSENGRFVKWPAGAYSTDFYTDKLLSFIQDNEEDGKPFFAYAAYTSPHWPLQVDSLFWKKYEQYYKGGYDSLRLSRFENLKMNGFIPKDAEMPELLRPLIPWDSLSEAQQQKETRKMALYAGMIENLDVNIGRLIDYLKKSGQYENTLIIFLSDNGAATRDYYNSHPRASQYFHTYYSNNYDNMGKENSLVSYGPQWAEAGSAPFRYFKDYATEGGTNTTMIMSGHGVQRSNERHEVFASLQDIAPTIYNMTGITYPDNYNNHLVYPLRGESMTAFLLGQEEIIHDKNYVFAFEHFGQAMLRKGNWKITNWESPFAVENFGLFNLENDLAENYDLKKEFPDKYQELLREWVKFSDEVRDIHPTPGVL